ncbi:MAG: hypothetical protein H6732_19810 [Alphaproteobacteria bacterium]|nr:hypothetical protein [Alphaproteobacteria bacterium]
MSHDPLHDRGKTLEDIFFAERDRQLLVAIKEKAAKQQAAVDLAALTGIQNGEVLDRLADLGLTPDTLAAFAIVPLLYVAWADEVLDDGEAEAILLEARAVGMRDDGPGYALLQSWLSRAPRPELFDAWRSYHQALRPHLTSVERQALHDDLLEKARRIARSSGGLFGLGSVSADEREALRKLDELLTA